MEEIQVQFKFRDAKTNDFRRKCTKIFVTIEVYPSVNEFTADKKDQGLKLNSTSFQNGDGLIVTGCLFFFSVFNPLYETNEVCEIP